MTTPTTLIEAGSDHGITAYRSPFSLFIPEPGELRAVAGDAAAVARVLRLKRGAYWTGYGSPTADTFLALADGVEPWMVPVASGDEDWRPMTQAELEAFAE